MLLSVEINLVIDIDGTYEIYLEELSKNKEIKNLNIIFFMIKSPKKFYTQLSGFLFGGTGGFRTHVLTRN